MSSFWSWAPQSRICNSCRRECLRLSIDRRVPSGRARGFHASAVSRRLAVAGSAVAVSSSSDRPMGSRPIRRARKTAGVSSVFAAGYATTLATVATSEAKRRVRYRDDMGRRLDTAREDLMRILHDPAPLNYNLTVGLPPSSVQDWFPDGQQTVPAPTVENTPTTTSPNEVVEAIKAICVPPAQLLSHAANAQRRETYLAWLHAQFGLRRRWRSKRPGPGAGLESLADAMLQEEIASQETMLEGQREPQHAEQFVRMVEATNRLVDSLIIEGHRIGSLGDPVSMKASMDSLDSPWHAMKLLRSDGYPNFSVPDLDPAATTTARLKTNDAARRIFENWAQVRIYGRPRRSAIDLALGRQTVSPEVWNAKEVKFWVAKLCYNMLVSPAPPGIHNYNILMLGFISVEQHTLARVVADSLLHDTRMLPTQQTLRCLLHQARAQGDVVGFHHVLRRLVALDPRGSKLRRRTIPDVAHTKNPENREWARSNDVNLAGGYVVQRATVDSSIVEAVITGLLSLDQVRLAAVVFSAYLNYSPRMDAATLNVVLNPVLDSVDITAARLMLRSLAKNSSLITDMLMREDRSARALSCKIRTLIAIATATEPTLHAQEEHVQWGQGRQMAKVQMEPRHAEEEYFDGEPESEEASFQEDDGLWTDADVLPTNPDELPELIYARTLYAKGKSLNKAQTKLLKLFGTAASSRVEPAKVEVFGDGETASAPMFNQARYSSRHVNYTDGINRLSSALFVSEATRYLKRLSEIVKAAQAALQTDERGFATGVDSWIDGFSNLAEQPLKHRREQEVYRRMARLKAVDQTAEAVFAACSHVMEAFMETITADLAATAAAATAAKAEADAAALQAGSGRSFLAIVKSFLQRTNVPFGLRLGTYLSTKQVTQEANTAAANSALPHEESPYDEFDNPQPPSIPFSLSPSLAQQTALLERHITTDMPAISTLLEARFKEILLQSVFPEKMSSRAMSLEQSIALRRDASSMSLDGLLEARFLLLKHNATLQRIAPALSITGGRPKRSGARFTSQDRGHEPPRPARPVAEPNQSYGIFRMGAVFSN